MCPRARKRTWPIASGAGTGRGVYVGEHRDGERSGHSRFTCPDQKHNVGGRQMKL